MTASPTKGLLDVILEASGDEPASSRPDETFFEAGAEANADFNAFHIPGFGETSQGGAASRLFEIDCDSDGKPTAARLTTA